MSILCCADNGGGTLSHHVIESDVLRVLQPKRRQVLDVALLHQSETTDLLSGKQVYAQDQNMRAVVSIDFLGFQSWLRRQVL